MNIITEASKIDWTLVTLGVFIALFAFREIIGIVSFIKNKFRIKTGIDQDKETIEKRISKLETHDEWQYNEISKISKGIEDISNQISSMQSKMDETEMAKLKDTLLNYYRKYKDIGEWTQFEHDAFWDLFKSYESHGGNGYLHTIVEPVMRELKIIE